MEFKDSKREYKGSNRGYKAFLKMRINYIPWNDIFSSFDFTE